MAYSNFIVMRSIYKRKIKNTLSLVLYLFSTPPSELFKLLSHSREQLPKISTRAGKNGKFSGVANDYLFQAIHTQGAHEPHFDEVVNILVNHSDVILDIGANIGTHSVIFARKVKSGKIYAIEPQSLIFSILQNNILYNGLANVIPLHYSITARNNHAVSMNNFSFVGEQINNGALGLKPFKNKNVIGEISLSRTIDSFNFNSISFLKMDIQGSEVMALAGAKKTIMQSRPIMYIEIEKVHLEALGYSTIELTQKIRSFRYAIYRLNVPPFFDHLCIPIEKISVFEKKLKKFTFTMTKI